MEYNGTNLDEVIKEHAEWLKTNRNCGSRADFSCTTVCNKHLNLLNLCYANFRHADLRDVSFSGSNLFGADFRYADLKNAIFHCANIGDAAFNHAKNIPDIPMACPETGAFIGYKKAYGISNKPGYTLVIIKLLIPEYAKRLSGSGRKCRASEAEVLEIRSIKGQKLKNCTGVSYYDSGFTYEVGKIVKPIKPFCTNRWEECASGIHFFMTKQEAIRY